MTVFNAIRVTLLQLGNTGAGGRRGSEANTDWGAAIGRRRTWPGCQPPRRSLKAIFKGLRTLRDLRCAVELEIRQAIEVGTRVVEFECQCNGHRVKCDVPLALGRQRSHLKHQPTIIQSTLSRRIVLHVAIVQSSAKIALQEMPLQFKMLCHGQAMAQGWQEAGLQVLVYARTWCSRPGMRRAQQIILRTSPCSTVSCRF